MSHMVPADGKESCCHISNPWEINLLWTDGLLGMRFRRSAKASLPGGGEMRGGAKNSLQVTQLNQNGVFHISANVLNNQRILGCVVRSNTCVGCVQAHFVCYPGYFTCFRVCNSVHPFVAFAWPQLKGQKGASRLATKASIKSLSNTPFPATGVHAMLIRPEAQTKLQIR